MHDQNIQARLARPAAAAALAAALLPIAAHAQRVNENATTQSSDAFGRSVGNEKTGLYNTDDVRGFNPVDAGNVRIEGLYFDQIDRLSQRVTESSTIRVGPAALRYPFPAPTGLVDHALIKPANEANLSLDLDSGSSSTQGLGGSIEFKLPFDGERLGLAGGAGFRNAVRSEGGHTQYRNLGATLAFRPGPGAEFLLFGSAFLTRSDEAHPTLYPAGAILPPKLPRGEDLAQTWTGRDTDSFTFGGIAKAPLGHGLRLESALFYTRRKHHHIFADILTGVAADGTVGARRIVADGDNADHSLSGEFRLVRQWQAGAITHQLTASLRGRARSHRFGGSRTLPLGPSTLLAPDLRPEPDYALGPKSHDEVRQITFGAAYNVVSRHGFSLDAGLSKSRYRKALDFADPALADPVTRDSPVLWNVAGSLAIIPAITLYAGVTRGQEEALVAPDIATNRSEAPPAIRTRQVEAGAKLALGSRLTLIVGAFKITKPYYNLDPALRYRQLGTLTNKGIELSLTGQLAPGLNLVGGTLLLDPHIAGEAADAGLIGRRPVGQVQRRSVANLDWRLHGGTSPVSFDMGIESLSSRMGNAANSLRAPARTSVTLGARYRFHYGQADLLLRPVVQNLFNSYGWQVSTSGGFTYTAARTFSLQLVADL